MLLKRGICLLQRIGKITHEGFSGNRASLLRTYVRLKLKAAFEQTQSQAYVHKDALLNFKVNYLSLPALLFLFKEIFINNDYHFEASSASPLIIDCGSNIGISVLFFKWIYPAARIVAFEADSNAFEILRKNVEDNRLTGVQLFNMAVYDYEGTVPFYYDPDEPGSALMSTNKDRLPKASRLVPCTMLSSYIEEDVDFLKMDIEGAEIKVVRELAEHRKLRNVKEMVIEYHHHISPTVDGLSELLSILEQNDFGYQFNTVFTKPFRKKSFQDILLYAYRK